MSKGKDKVAYRRLNITNEELLKDLRELGSVAAVARKHDVGYQTAALRIKKLRDGGVVIPTRGKAAKLDPESRSRLQAVIDA